MPLMANENIAIAASVLASGRLWDARKASSAEHPTARAGAYPAGSPIGPVSWSDVDFIGLLLVIVQCTMTRLCLGLKVPREIPKKLHQYDATDRRGPDRAGEVATSFTVAGRNKGDVKKIARLSGRLSLKNAANCFTRGRARSGCLLLSSTPRHLKPGPFEPFEFCANNPTTLVQKLWIRKSAPSDPDSSTSDRRVVPSGAVPTRIHDVHAASIPYAKRVGAHSTPSTPAPTHNPRVAAAQPRRRPAVGRY